MNAKQNLRSLLGKLFHSPVPIAATAMFVLGLLLGVTVHKGFLILLALGAFGPSLLRQFRWLNDLDEFQSEAAAAAGNRAYLVSAVFLMAVTVGRTWHNLSLGDDGVPASTVLTLMLVVYYASYCLSFWDARKAVSIVLTVIGAFWLTFVVLSHGGEPATFAIESLVVPAPILLCGVLCRCWPRTVAVILIAAAAGSIYLFNLLPVGADAELYLKRGSFVFFLIPLPLLISAFALFASSRADRVASA